MIRVADRDRFTGPVMAPEGTLVKDGPRCTFKWGMLDDPPVPSRCGFGKTSEGESFFVDIEANHKVWQVRGDALVPEDMLTGAVERLASVAGAPAPQPDAGSRPAGAVEPVEASPPAADAEARSGSDVETPSEPEQEAATEPTGDNERGSDDEAATDEDDDSDDE